MNTNKQKLDCAVNLFREELKKQGFEKKTKSLFIKPVSCEVTHGVLILPERSAGFVKMDFSLMVFVKETSKILVEIFGRNDVTYSGIGQPVNASLMSNIVGSKATEYTYMLDLTWGEDEIRQYVERLIDLLCFSFSYFRAQESVDGVLSLFNKDKWAGGMLHDAIKTLLACEKNNFSGCSKFIEDLLISASSESQKKVAYYMRANFI